MLSFTVNIASVFLAQIQFRYFKWCFKTWSDSSISSLNHKVCQWDKSLLTITKHSIISNKGPYRKCLITQLYWVLVKFTHAHTQKKKSALISNWFSKWTMDFLNLNSNNLLHLCLVCDLICIKFCLKPKNYCINWMSVVSWNAFELITQLCLVALNAQRPKLMDTFMNVLNFCRRQ